MWPPAQGFLHLLDLDSIVHYCTEADIYSAFGPGDEGSLALGATLSLEVSSTPRRSH